MIRVVVSGYASVDHVLHVSPAPRPDRTSIVRRRLTPRQGGCVGYVARALSLELIPNQDGFEAAAISWVGDDAEGRAYIAALEDSGVHGGGVEQVAAGRTPASILAYDEAGGCTCLFDPGMNPPSGLTPAQRSLATESGRWAVITVGPAGPTRELLTILPKQSCICWAVKADPDAFPPDLCRELARRATLIAYSVRERDFVAPVLEAAGREDRILLETRGTAGVAILAHGDETVVPVEPVDTPDTTGAGDMFLGATLAGLVKRPALMGKTSGIAATVKSGIRFAGEMLARRRAGPGQAEWL